MRQLIWVGLLVGFMASAISIGRLYEAVSGAEAGGAIRVVFDLYTGFVNELFQRVIYIPFSFEVPVIAQHVIVIYGVIVGSNARFVDISSKINTTSASYGFVRRVNGGSFWDRVLFSFMGPAVFYFIVLDIFRIWGAIVDNTRYINFDDPRIPDIITTIDKKNEARSFLNKWRAELIGHLGRLYFYIILLVVNIMAGILLVVLSAV